MAFAALIAAYQEAEDGAAGLRAMLPMAGRSLLEHQVRRAIEAGASHAVVLVERVPAELSAALDRLKRDGIAVRLARDPMDAADHFHPEEAVLLVADGLVAAPDCFEAMAARTAPTILVVADTPDNTEFERVDASHRWAGLALTTVESVAATAQMLGEWDLQSTLMRRIVQGGADFLPVDGDAGVVVDASEAVLLAEGKDDSRDAGHTMLRRNSVQVESWPERFLYGPIAIRVAPMLLDRRLDAIWLRGFAILLTAAGAAAIWMTWLWTGLILLLLAGPIDAIAGRIDLAQLRDYEGSWELRAVRGFAQATAMLAMGSLAWAETGEAAYPVMAIMAILLLVLARRASVQIRKFPNFESRLMPWLADGNAAIWLIIPFAAAALWYYWPIAVVIYAYITLILQQNIIREGVRNRD
ncbi:hypothetical protein HFP51_05480 [Parasphingopyxis sp. CP4]|uniref:hypothetical protein n=1 Tax=Parasphingopyxis sp. CP4 TaxID=2724527 RepID=UPI0015A1C67C|nr:hypothetical protein [Parasphingopyxis sp. CP4]QLC21676.1 hypothetical protein HFP51_05480 [Parasphingopyxis sp. CP4]